MAIKRQDAGCRQGGVKWRTGKLHVCGPKPAGRVMRGEREENKEGRRGGKEIEKHEAG